MDLGAFIEQTQSHATVIEDGDAKFPCHGFECSAGYDFKIVYPLINSSPASLETSYAALYATTHALI